MIDPAAFSQTKLKTVTLNIWHCNLNRLNWSFLAGFANLKDLQIDSSNNFPVTFYTFPSASLTGLWYLTLKYLSEMDKFAAANIKYPHFLKNSLKTIVIEGIVYPNILVDASIQNFLANWITPSSRKTLAALILNNNNWTKIPSEVAKYENLDDAYFLYNTQSWVIQKNAFNFAKNTSRYQPTLKINNSGIKSIQPGAFQGFDTFYLLCNNN